MSPVLAQFAQPFRFDSRCGMPPAEPQIDALFSFRGPEED
jgi:hypothetical protein